MHLPQIHSDEWAINYDSDDRVETGDCLYFAPDGAIMAVTHVSRTLVALQDLSTNETTTVHRTDVTDGIGVDYFPVRRT